MTKSSIFKIKINFKKSKNSFIFDQNRKKKFLDFFGQYSTLTVGYNSYVFDKIYSKIISAVSKQKIVNCEIQTDFYNEFDQIFRDKMLNNNFTFTHYTCTGALAVESAIKTAIEYSNGQRKSVLTFKGSFHGINSYGGIFTDRFYPVNKRLKNFPGNYYPKLDGYFCDNCKNCKNKNFEKKILKIKKFIVKYNPCAILIEPIQSTYGDRYFCKKFLKKIQLLSKKNNIPLIFDEIQTGFFASGKQWYYEHLNIIPDILIFGKKAQVSGIAVKKKYSKIFKNSTKLEVTFDSDIIDMIRSKTIIEYFFKKKYLINNIQKISSNLINFLKSKKQLINVRGVGFLIAFDLKSKKLRDKIHQRFFKHGLLSNATRDRTIRLRPNLLLNDIELKKFKLIINKSIKNI